MFIVRNVTANAKQKQTLQLPDGSSINISMYFVSMQYGWLIKELTYKNFTVNGLRICNSPNMLHQFRNQIPFGLKCETKGGREPSQQNDFSDGFSKLYILDADEVRAYAELLTGEV